MRNKKPAGSKPAPSSSKRKKEYQTPRLVEYGDLRRIVMAGKATNRSDGVGKPATKR